MKLLVTGFLTLTMFYVSAQNYEQCTRKDLPKTQFAVSLKGSVIKDTIFISLNELKEGIELKLPSSIGNIVGYYAVSGCPDCNIISIPVCGSKMEEKLFQRINHFRNGDWLEFYRINIEINGKRYLAPEFIVYIKK